jgi:transmembrane sensor
MNARAAVDLRLAEEAASWVMRRLEDRSPECNGEFLRWLKESPHHIDEFLMAAAMYASLREGKVDGNFTIEELLGGTNTNVVSIAGDALAPASHEDRDAEGRRPRGRSTTKIWGTLAASIGTAAVGGWLFWSWIAGTYSTSVGEQRMVRLEDGSVMHLNTRSKVHITFSDTGRELRLIEGEAFLNIVKDSTRPFTVLTRDAAVHVLGTEFNVYECEDETRVAVVDGEVRVSARTANATPKHLHAGEQADVSSSGKISSRTIPDIGTALSWRERQLIFRAVPLATVAEQFNRYNEFQIQIEGEKLRQRLIWGVFPVDDPQALVKFLAQDKSVRLTQRRGELTVGQSGR